MRGGGTGVIGLRYIVVRVVRGICGCAGIDCSVFVVVRVVRGFYEGGGGSRKRLVCEICCKSCKSCKRI